MNIFQFKQYNESPYFLGKNFLVMGNHPVNIGPSSTKESIAKLRLVWRASLFLVIGLFMIGQLFTAYLLASIAIAVAGIMQNESKDPAYFGYVTIPAVFALMILLLAFRLVAPLVFLVRTFKL